LILTIKTRYESQKIHQNVAFVKKTTSELFVWFRIARRESYKRSARIIGSRRP